MRTFHGAAPAAATILSLPTPAANEPATVTLAEHSEARPTALSLTQISNNEDGRGKLVIRRAGSRVAKTATEMAIETR